MKSITNLFYDALGAGEDPEVSIILQPDGEGPEMAIAQNLSNNLENLRNICGANGKSRGTAVPTVHGLPCTSVSDLYHYFK